MPNQFLTLKDITAREGTDDVVGLVENIINVAPEIDRVLGRPIKGISYRARIETAIGSNAAFRKVNGGVNISAPSYDRKRFNCFPFDCVMEIDEADFIEGEAEGDTPGKLMTDVSSASMRQKAIKLGKQFYQGTLNDALGCPGLIDFLTTQRTQIDSRTGAKINQVVDAGGNSNTCEIVWFIKQGPQGVHWLFGNGQGIRQNPWRPYYVNAADNSGQHLAWKSNIFGYLGTSMAQYHAVGAIINVDAVGGANGAGATPLTDNLVAQLYALFPITIKPDLAFCTQNAARTLQISRTVTNFVSGAGREWTKGAAPVADYPTSLPTAGGIPLITTDSIVPGAKTVLA